MEARWSRVGPSPIACLGPDPHRTDPGPGQGAGDQRATHWAGSDWPLLVAFGLLSQRNARAHGGQSDDLRVQSCLGARAQTCLCRCRQDGSSGCLLHCRAATGRAAAHALSAGSGLCPLATTDTVPGASRPDARARKELLLGFALLALQRLQRGKRPSTTG